MADFTLRPGEPADSRRCFGVFRASLADLMVRIGYRSSHDADADAAWPSYEPLFAHLARTAGAWWIAEDGAGRTIGYARSTLRATTVELTEFFVAPDARVAGSSTPSAPGGASTARSSRRSTPRPSRCTCASACATRAPPST
jgi:hypothetical protein